MCKRKLKYIGVNHENCIYSSKIVYYCECNFCDKFLRMRHFNYSFFLIKQIIHTFQLIRELFNI